MKKIMSVVLFCIAALSGCNDGDNGDLAGEYQSDNKDQIILTFNNNDKNYIADYRQYIDLSKVNKYAQPSYAQNSTIGRVVRDGEFLVMPSENNKKIFKIENGNLKAVYNKNQTIYIINK